MARIWIRRIVESPFFFEGAMIGVGLVVIVAKYGVKEVRLSVIRPTRDLHSLVLSATTLTLCAIEALGSYCW